MKTICSLVLATILLLALGTMVMAEETGTITINNPVAKQTYNVYRIFNLESFDEQKNAYSYTVNPQWADFATQNSILGTYINFVNNYVYWINSADTAAFAQEAIAYANVHTDTVTVTGTGTAADEDPAPVVISNLPLGYYLVDSSVGTVCALTTTASDATIIEKNTLTTVEKTVKEDSTGRYEKENSAQFGDTLYYRCDITIGEGCVNLVLHDDVEGYGGIPSFDFNKDSVKVYIGEDLVDPENYTVLWDDPWAECGCYFEFDFDNEYIASLKAGTILRVEYELDRISVGKYVRRITNNAWVSFGNNILSETSSTETKCYGFHLLKTDENYNIIDGAKFQLYTSKEGGSPIVFFHFEDGDMYSVLGRGELDYATTVISAGEAQIQGLDLGTYWLEEIEAPQGYQKLTGRVAVTLSGDDLYMLNYADSEIVADLQYYFPFCVGVGYEDVMLDWETYIGQNIIDKQWRGVQVINKAGTMLPSTGGTGTTWIYVTAAALILSAVLIQTIDTVSRKKKTTH